MGVVVGARLLGSTHAVRPPAVLSFGRGVRLVINSWLSVRAHPGKSLMVGDDWPGGLALAE